VGAPQVVDVDAVLAGYGGWLKRQPLAARSREAYLAQVRDFVTWLAGSEHGAQALVDPHVRDWAVRDYKRFAKTTKRWGPASVNQAADARMSSKRNHDKKSWNRRHRKQPQAPAGEPRPVGTPIPLPRIRVPPQPTELDQGAAMIVQEELGLPTTSVDALRAVCRRLPCEPTLRLLALLAGRVESAGIDATKHLEVAEWFYGPVDLVRRYREFVANNPGRAIFAPQALYSLMRIFLEEAYEAPIAQDLTVNERQDLTSALLACNSVTARRIDMNFGDLQQDLLAFELQVGHYYHRGRWMEDIVLA
jgi:hypothetical protein